MMIILPRSPLEIGELDLHSRPCDVGQRFENEHD